MGVSRMTGTPWQVINIYKKSDDVQYSSSKKSKEDKIKKKTVVKNGVKRTYIMSQNDYNTIIKKETPSKTNIIKGKLPKSKKHK